MYFSKEKNTNHSINYEGFTIMSPDERLQVLTKVAQELDRQNLKYKFVTVGNKRPENLLPTIEFSENK